MPDEKLEKIFTDEEWDTLSPETRSKINKHLKFCDNEIFRLNLVIKDLYAQIKKK